MDINKYIFDFLVRWVDYFLGAVDQLVGVDDYKITTNSTDEEVLNFILSLNKNRSAVQSIKTFSTDGFLEFMFDSRGSIVFLVDCCEVLKFYKNDYSAKILSDIEYGAYHDLSHLPNIPLIHGLHVHGDIRYLAMDYCGPDGMTLYNNKTITYEMWKAAVFDLGECLDDIHALNRVHGDIKVENITWDGDQWFFIDFGLGYSGRSSSDRKHKFNGTFPNILPVYGLPGDVDNHVFKLCTYDRRRWSDYYAFALTMLSLAGVDLPGAGESSIDYLVNVHVGRMYRIFMGDIILIPPRWRLCGTSAEIAECAQIMRTLVAIPLTQLDHRRENLKWDPASRKCQYHGFNEGWEAGKYTGPTSMMESWSDIYKIKESKTNNQQ
jgi:hypothetical protein